MGNAVISPIHPRNTQKDVREEIKVASVISHGIKICEEHGKVMKGWQDRSIGEQAIRSVIPKDFDTTISRN